jgi:hypothetical protein
MLFHLVTNVWGVRHTDLFLEMTLPNLLSDGNLPALASVHRVVYRIHTTLKDMERIKVSASGKMLAKLVPVEFVTPLGDRTPDVTYHVHWFHKTAAEAKIRGAVVCFIPPDTLWSDGSLRRCGEIMISGYKAIAVPFLQVVMETCLPDVKARFKSTENGTITIPQMKLAELGRSHLHPLTTLALPNSPHGRPALDFYWPVGKEGFISRFGVRELFAFDPRRCQITFLWYAGGKEDQTGIYFGEGSHDIAMLSVDPLHKYFDNYILEHTNTPGDIVRSTLHPLNDTKQTSTFVKRAIYWRISSNNLAAWRQAKYDSDKVMREVEIRRIMHRIWSVLNISGCKQIARILALVLGATNFSEVWRQNLPLTIFITSDEAYFGDIAERIQSWLLPGKEDLLIKFIKRHVITGNICGEKNFCISMDGTILNIQKSKASLSVSGFVTKIVNHDIEGLTIFKINGTLF